MLTTWIQHNLLTFLIFAPIAWGIILLCTPERQSFLARLLGVLGALGIFLVGSFHLMSLGLGTGMESASFCFTERQPWFVLVDLPVDYHLMVDGLNLWLVMLTLFLGPLTLLGTWNSFKERPGSAFGIFLMLQGMVVGCLLAQDLLLFYLFWEAMLLPMFILIALWGGEDRRYAANKFILYTLAGSLLWLVALLFLASKAGSFNPDIIAQTIEGLPFKTQCYVFLAFALAFAIKVPLFPLHTWLPDAHTEAPTAGSVVLAGVLLKLGGYGLLRFALPMLPVPALFFAKPIAVLAVIAIVYGAMVAMVQWDIKKLVAYSSVSHMGFVMLGIASMTLVGTQGAILQMLNHGISTGAMFLMVGMLYDRAHTRQIADFGGVAKRMPRFTFFFMVITLSSIGLPLTNGFVGEFLILNGTFQSGFTWGRPLALVAILGILLSAVYMLWMFKRVFWGPENAAQDSGTSRLKDDLNMREMAVLTPLLILIFWIGIQPRIFMSPSESLVGSLMGRIKPPAALKGRLGLTVERRGPPVAPVLAQKQDQDLIRHALGPSLLCRSELATFASSDGRSSSNAKP